MYDELELVKVCLKVEGIWECKNIPWLLVFVFFESMASLQFNAAEIIMKSSKPDNKPKRNCPILFLRNFLNLF